MKKILILNGSPRKNGKTASLVNAFAEGAESSGNEVRESYIQGMKIGGCLACEACSRNGGHCVQNRIGYADMSKQYKETAFIMTARGDYYRQALDFYSIFTKMMGWKDWGMVLGAGREDDARKVGASIN